jgi:hypothetical protein
MKRTSKYQLAYFEQDDITSAVSEMQRWTTLDAQLQALFNIMGNGVLDGWELLTTSGLSITVTPGSAHVDFVAVSTDVNVTITNITPNARNYIYAQLQDDSYWTKAVTFGAFSYMDDLRSGLFIGYVDASDTRVTDINGDERKYLGFIGLIRQVVASHRHIGGEDNPEPVNLGTDVQGVLNQRNLPDLDASILKSGKLDASRLPLVDHITQLVNQGTLTHAQLDSYIESLSLLPASMMGEVSTVNLLQLILAIKHVYPEIDEYLLNEIAFIPGISPDEFIDLEHTTANVDTRPYHSGGTHTIYGTPAPAKRIYTKAWRNEIDFKNGTYRDVFIDGDTVALAVTEDTRVIDDFSSISGWTVSTTDLSVVPTSVSLDSTSYVSPPASGKIVVGDDEVEVALVFKKKISAQDWSSFNYLVFYLKTDNVQHGDVYFYLNDAIAGTQQSYTKVLSRNIPTVNVNTLQNGWQEVIVDISSYTRTAINTAGFKISTTDGWDSSVGFDLNMDYFYLSSGNQFVSDGYVRVIFGGDFLYDFWRVRWDAIIPDDSLSTGIMLKSRTRVGNTLEDLAQAVWSSYSYDNTYDIALPTSSLYKYIEIEAYLGASDSLQRSPYLRKLYLDFYASDIDNTFDFTTQSDWESGSLFNVDTNSLPGSMMLSGVDEINNVYYGTQGVAAQCDAELMSLYRISGTMAPRSTNQVLANETPSLGLVTGVARGSEGSFWVTDIDNDRVMEFGKDGQLLTALYGSFLNPPVDSYGLEEAGPGSNVEDTEASNVSATTTTTSTAIGTAVTTTLDVLHSIYNPDTGILYVVFDDTLENIYSSNKIFKATDFYLAIGSHRFPLDNATFTLLGVDEAKWRLWGQFSSSPFLSQFTFNTHVLQVVLNDTDKVFMNHMANMEAPSIVILSPYVNQLGGDSLTVKFVTYNFTLGSVPGETSIQYRVDGGSWQTTYLKDVIISGISSGQHTLESKLMQAGATAYENIEASASTTFIVVPSGEYSQPYVKITAPKPTQIYSSSPVAIEFETPNFAILPEGQHIRYIVDSDSPIDYYYQDPIIISNLTAGKHYVTIQLVDRNGNVLAYDYAQASVAFIVGLNSEALVTLYIGVGAIKSLNGKTTTASSVSVDVGNISMANIYAPIDVQVLPPDASSADQTNLTLLIAKMRSPSWTEGLGDSDNFTELLRRMRESTTTTTTAVPATNEIVSTATDTTTTLTPEAQVFSDVSDAMLIYGSKYLDGHSVVQMTVNGDIVMSNNAGVFARTKEDAKWLLGSAEKVGDNEILVADSVRKRAIITYTDLETQTPKIEWQYDSDRYVADFHLEVQSDIVVYVDDDAIRENNVFVKQGTPVIWENRSSEPIYIYSGTTTYDTFYADPDLNLYGDEFKSGIMNPGDRFLFKFTTVGEYDWFVYPGILIGKVNVIRNRISPRDRYVLLENDNFDSPFTSRVLKLDAWGNIVWSFGDGYLVHPKDARPLLNGGVIIST